MSTPSRVLGSVLTTWMTFVPCFLFIFVGAPWIVRGRRGLTLALSEITAAVVGVIVKGRPRTQDRPRSSRGRHEAEALPSPSRTHLPRAVYSPCGS
jgi:hypothetical protein